jgi:hypothetical protein
MTTYNQLLAAALCNGFEPQRQDEDDNAYLTRLAVAVSQVPDELWASISLEAQQWCTVAVLGINAGQTVRDPLDGFLRLEVAPKLTVVDGDGEVLRDASEEYSPAGNVVVFPTSDDVEEVEPEEEEEIERLPPIKTDLIRAVVIEHPDWTHPQIMAHLGPGANPYTVSTIRSVTLKTVEIARGLGKWRD